MMRFLKSEKGISLVGAVLSLIILSMFGAAIVALVAAEQEFRGRDISKVKSFYINQAGIEYAIRQIKLGGAPIVSNKAFGSGNFTVNVNYDGGSNRFIIVTSNVGEVQETHQITYNYFGGDCLVIDHSTAVLTAAKDKVKNVKLKVECNDAVTIDKIVASWTPDNGEKVTRFDIRNVTVWQDAMGQPSGTVLDVQNTSLAGGQAHPVNEMFFDSNMQYKMLTLTFILTDNTFTSATFQLLPP